MSIGALDATAAYGRALGVGKTGGIAGSAPAAPVAGGFGGMVEAMVTDADGTRSNGVIHQIDAVLMPTN